MPPNPSERLIEQSDVSPPVEKGKKPSAFWHSPLLLTIIGSAGTLALAIFSNSSQQNAARELEQLRLESSLILKAFEPKEQVDRTNALNFLLEAGLIRDKEGKIAKLAAKGVPHIAASDSLQSFSQRWEPDLTTAEIASAEADAKAQAEQSGVSSALAIRVIADSIIQHGRNTTRKLANDATAKVGGQSNAKADERDWLNAFLEARRAHVQRVMPSAVSVFRRIDELQQLVNPTPTPAAR